MPFFTVFTPTYNRANILPSLYRTLCSQSCKNFGWLILSDASEDDSQSVVQEWSQDEVKSFTIHYYKKANGGNLFCIFKNNKLGHSFITLPIGILLYFRRKKTVWW